MATIPLVPDGYTYDPQDDSFIDSSGKRYGSNYAGTGLEFMSSSNPMYDAYYKANPYVNQTYHKTLIDRLFGGIFRTGYDKWRDEMAVNAAQYNAGIVDMQQQNQYNSEEQKAMRMRAAGENPDLLGTGDVADAANTNPDPQDAQIPEADSIANAFGAVTNFIGGFGDLFSGAVAMMKTFQDINIDKIRADNDVAGLAQDDLFRLIPNEGFADDKSFQEWFNYTGNVFDDNPNYFKDFGIPRQFQERYRKAFLDARTSLPTDLKYYQNATERAKLRNELGFIRGSRFYREGIDELDAVIQPLVKLQDDVKELHAEIDKLTALNAKTMQGDIIPEVMQNQDLALDVERKQIANESIQADISGDYLEGLQSEGYGQELSAAAIAQARIGKLIAKAQSEIIANLKTLSDDGNRFAKCLEYQMVLSQFYNFNPANILTGAVSDRVNSTKQTAAMLARIFL